MLGLIFFFGKLPVIPKEVHVSKQERNSCIGFQIALLKRKGKEKKSTLISFVAKIVPSIEPLTSGSLDRKQLTVLTGFISTPF